MKLHSQLFATMRLRRRLKGVDKSKGCGGLKPMSNAQSLKTPLGGEAQTLK